MRRRDKGHSARSAKPAGIREIAQSLGVSIGTVDRALHDRPGISAQTRGRILERARSLGYSPNLAARFLSSRKPLRIGVNLPREIASFFDLVRSGIDDAFQPFKTTGVEIVHRSYPRLGMGEKEALEEALTDDLHGLVIVPGRPEPLAALMSRAAARRLPIVCVNTDAPRAEHLATVCVDSLTNGSLVGELMGRFLNRSGRVVVVTGQLSTIDHAQKLEGFRRAIAEMSPGLAVAAVVEAHDDEREAYKKCRKVFGATPNVAGVYVSTANSIPVLRALDDTGAGDGITVVTTDLFPALAPLIESGRVAATMYQRPWFQGQVAFQSLYHFLVEGVRPASVINLSPHIVMRSNLKLFLDRMVTERAAAGGGRTDAGMADEIA